MNILVLCDRYPSSMQDGLSLRVIHYVRCLRERHDFDLVCYGPADDSTDIPALFRSVEVFDMPSVVKKTGIDKLVDALNVDALYPVSDAVKSHLHGVIQARGYNAIWDAGSNMLLNLPQSAKGIPLLADTVDDLALTQWRHFKRSNTLNEKIRNLKQFILYLCFERKYISSADANLLVSEVDASSYAKICPGRRVEVIHNGVDADYFQPLNLPKSPRNLVFEGSVSFGPNTDGILYFVHEILPLIRNEVPDVTFTVVGRDPPPEIQSLAGEYIFVTGFVDDVRPYVDQAEIFVCPLRGGAGIKNKLLQAWAMGKAVVATTPSIGGLRVSEGNNIVVRDDSASFAAAVVSLLNEPERAKRIGENARKTIQQFYTWDRKARELEKLFQSIVSQV